MFDLHLSAMRARRGVAALTTFAALGLASCAMPVDGDTAGDTSDDSATAVHAGELSAAPGTLDSSFGARCVDTTAHFSVNSGVHALLLADGKILTAMSVTDPSTGASEVGLI